MEQSYVVKLWNNLVPPGETLRKILYKKHHSHITDIDYLVYILMTYLTMLLILKLLFTLMTVHSFIVTLV